MEATAMTRRQRRGARGRRGVGPNSGGRDLGDGHPALPFAAPRSPRVLSGSAAGEAPNPPRRNSTLDPAELERVRQARPAMPTRQPKPASPARRRKDELTIPHELEPMMRAADQVTGPAGALAGMLAAAAAARLARHTLRQTANQLTKDHQ